ERHTGRAERLHTRCPALLLTCGGSGRLHYPGLHAATPSQIDQGLRSGAENPRAVQPHAHPIIATAACYSLNWTAVAVCEQSQIALVLVAYSPIWGFAAYRHARNPGRANSPYQTNVASC